MPENRTLLDTGALVALLWPEEETHESCAKWYQSYRGTLLTTEIVLSEAVYLLNRYFSQGAGHCLDFFIRGGAFLVPMTEGKLVRCKELMEKYKDAPMDFADATLVALAEELGIRKIFTLDKRDFGMYRLKNNKTFEIAP